MKPPKNTVYFFSYLIPCLLGFREEWTLLWRFFSTLYTLLLFRALWRGVLLSEKKFCCLSGYLGVVKNNPFIIFLGASAVYILSRKTSLRWRCLGWDWKEVREQEWQSWDSVQRVIPTAKVLRQKHAWWVGGPPGGPVWLTQHQQGDYRQGRRSERQGRPDWIGPWDLAFTPGKMGRP